MFVPSWLYTAVVYGLVLAAAGGLYAYYKVERKLIALAVVAGAGGCAFVLHHVHVDAIHVHDGDGGPDADRGVRLGVPDLPLAAPDAPTGKLWIINDASQPARIRWIGITGDLMPAIVIPPNTMLVVRDIDYVGPNNRPPEDITVEGGEIQRARAWLTWGR